MDVVVMNDGTFFCALDNFDMVHYDMNMEEVKRVKGNPDHNISAFFSDIIKNRKVERRVTQPTGISKKMLWMNTPTTLSILDLESMKPSEVMKFWTFNSQHCLGMSVTCTPDFKRFAGLGLTSDGMQTLHLYDIAGQTGFSSASVKSLLTNSSCFSKLVVKVYGMEFSYKQTILFLCGGDQKTQRGTLAALKFSSQPKLITEVPILKVDGSPAGVATAMVRQSSGNILFVGLESRVNLYFFDGSHFEVLAEYTSVGDGLVWQMQIVDEELYCGIGDEAEFMRVLYAGRNSSYFNNGSLKPDKSIAQQFALSANKSVKLPEKVGWMRKGLDKDLYLRVLGKLSINDRTTTFAPDLAKPTQTCTLVFHDLTRAKNGRFIYTSAHSNVLKVSSSKFGMIAYKGPCSKAQTYATETIPYFSTVSEPGTFLWPMGDTVLGIVDTETLEIDRIPGLGGLGAQYPLAYLALSAQQGRKVVTVALRTDSHDHKKLTPYLTYWQKMDKNRPVTRSAEHLMPKRRIEPKVSLMDKRSRLYF
jgi:hypothetical protein